MFALRTLRKRKWILLLPPLFVCVSLTCFPTFSQTHSASVVDLDGRPADPFRLAGSKIVVLLFVRTDCPISNRYAPTIQDLSEAIVQFAEAVRLHPNDSMAEANLGAALAESGQLLDAQTHLERALKLDPQNTVASDDLAEVKRRQASSPRQ